MSAGVDTRTNDVVVTLGEGRIAIGTGYSSENGKRIEAISFQEMVDQQDIGTARTCEVVGRKFWLGFSHPDSIDVVIGQLNRMKEKLKQSDASQAAISSEEK